MPYTFYLGELQLPVTPSKLQIKINNNNKVVTLINEGEINILKSPGLKEVTFEALLPNVKYPFSNNYKFAKYYLEALEDFKANKRTFRFKIIRTKPNGDYLFDTNIMVSLEDYTIKEDAEKYGMDVGVSIKLKEYRAYSTKVISIKTNTLPVYNSENRTVTIKKNRPSDKVIPKVHTVKKGETLWAICKKEMGDGSKYAEIAKLNGISNPNLIKIGQVIKLG